MKFQQFLKIKGKVHESEIADLLKDTDRLIESYSYNNGEVLNESEGAGAEIMKMITSMVKYVKLISQYPKLKQSYYDLKLEQDEELSEFDVASDEQKEEFIEKTKEKFRKQKEAISASNMDGIKKKQAREKINMTMKNAEEGIKTAAAKRVEIAKTNLEKKQAAELQKITDTISELETKNKPESELIAARWDKEKTEIDLEKELSYNDKKLEIDVKYLEDPNQAEKLEKRAAERNKNAKTEAKTMLDKKVAEEEETKQEFETKLANAQGDTKIALETLRDFQTAITEYITAGKDLASAPDDDAKQDAAKEKREELQSQKKKITAGLMKKAGLTTDDEEAQTMAAEFVNSADNTIQEVSDIGGESLSGGKDTEAKRAAKLTKAGYGPSSETEEDLKKEKKTITLADNTTQSVSKWSIKKLKKDDGTDEIYVKEKEYDDTGKLKENYGIFYINFDNLLSETEDSITNNNPRIVPTFESYVKKYC